MHIKTPRLIRNRLGVYYFRVKLDGIEKRLSLRTKCSQTANILALQLNLDIERKRLMSNPLLADLGLDADRLRRYELDLKNGVAKAKGPADHKRMMEAIDKIGMLPPDLPSYPTPGLHAPAPPPAPVIAPSMPLSAATKVWLAERAKKNAPRTVDAERFHIADFARHLGADLPVNELSKPVVVGYKNARLGEGQTGKTVDNKLMTLHDFFKYLSANALYTASDSNPVDGLFVLTKRERVKKNEPYQPFTNDDLQAFFDPASYPHAMDAPDLFWSPLVAAYTGMRISEATAIRCDDVRQANGVHYIHIPESKTTAGVRNAPISDALIELGFLDYVAEARAAGCDRIYPDRTKVNHTYSKELSRAMLEYQAAIGIKKENDHKSFHSFRVNVITAMADNGANTPQVMKIVGHKNGGSDETHLGYVRELKELKPIVDALSWPIDVAALRYDGRYEEFLLNKKNWAGAKPKRKAANAASVKNKTVKAQD